MTEAEELELLELEAEEAAAAQKGAPKFQPVPEDAPNLPRARNYLKSAPRDGYVGPVETYFGKAANAIPLGRTAASLLSAGGVALADALGKRDTGVHFTPRAIGEMGALGIDMDHSVAPDALDTYRQSRDVRDARLDVGSEANPIASMAGTGTGLAASALAPLPKALGGSAFGQQGLRVAQGGGQGLGTLMLAGGTLGAAQSFGDSRADLTKGEYMDALLDTVQGGAFGAAAAPLGYGAAKVAPTALRKTRDVLRGWAGNTAQRAMLNGSEALTNKISRPEAGIEAIRSHAVLPFGTARGAEKRLERLTEHWGDTYSGIVADLEARGVQGPEAASLARDLIDRSKVVSQNNMNRQLPKLWTDAAEDIGAKLPAGESRFPLTQAENLKRGLQKDAIYGRIEDKALNEEKLDLAAVFRQANEDAIDDAATRMGGEVADIAETFKPVKQKLGNLLEARKMAMKGAPKGEKRALIGLTELAAASAGHDLPTALLFALSARVAKTRGPSTAASGAYYASELARLLANGAATANARGLPMGAARASMAVGRGAMLPTYVQRNDNGLVRGDVDTADDALIRILRGE